MEEPVDLSVADGVAAITLNRPSRGNAIDLTLASALKDIVQAIAGDGRVRVVTIAGAGRLFCSGGDLAAISGSSDDAPSYVRELLTNLHQALTGLAALGVPVIAGVHGAAAGAGFSLACACDLAIATRSSRFVLAYSQVGLTPDGSASYYLPRLIGLRRALQLALTNRELTADEALNWGILNEVVEDDQLPGAIDSLARQLADGATGALGGAKRLMRDSFSNSLDAQLTAEMETICTALESGDAKEGLAAFLARRKPAFRG